MRSAVRRHPVLARVILYAAVVLVAVPMAFAFAITRPFRAAGGRAAALASPSGCVVSEGLRLRVWTVARLAGLGPDGRHRPRGGRLAGELRGNRGHEFAFRGYPVAARSTPAGHGGSEGT